MIETAQLEDVVGRPLAGRRTLVAGGSRGIIADAVAFLARIESGSSLARAGTSMVASLFNPPACLPFGSRLDSYLDGNLNPRHGSHQ